MTRVAPSFKMKQYDNTMSVDPYSLGRFQHIIYVSGSQNHIHISPIPIVFKTGLQSSKMISSITIQILNVPQADSHLCLLIATTREHELTSARVPV
jgi:hypothetical protein